MRNARAVQILDLLGRQDVASDERLVAAAVERLGGRSRTIRVVPTDVQRSRSAEYRPAVERTQNAALEHAVDVDLDGTVVGPDDEMPLIVAKIRGCLCARRVCNGTVSRNGQSRRIGSPQTE